MKNTATAKYPKSTGASSAKFGPCEVCGIHATEVFISPLGQSDVVFGHVECVSRPEIADVVADFRARHHGYSR